MTTAEVWLSAYAVIESRKARLAVLTEQATVGVATYREVDEMTADINTDAAALADVAAEILQDIAARAAA